MKMNALDWIAFVLVIIGGLNLGIVGISSYDVLGGIFGMLSTLTRIIYILIGLSALYMLFASPGKMRTS